MKNIFLKVVLVIFCVCKNVQALENNISIHSVAEQGNDDILKLLIKNGADVNAKDIEGNTPLRRAEKAKKYSAMKILVKNGANPITFKNLNTNLTNIHIRSNNGDNQALEALLSNLHTIPNLNELRTDFFGVTPLHLAAEKGHDKIVKLLLEKGMDVDIRDRMGDTPLRRAEKAKKYSTMEILVKNGANPITFRNLRTYFTNIHHVCYNGDYKTLKALISNQKNHHFFWHCSLRYDKHYTPLHLAAEQGHDDIIKLLIDNKININITDGQGKTPLYRAQKAKKFNVMKILVENGANIVTYENKKNRLTNLHSICFNGDVKSLKILLGNIKTIPDFKKLKMNDIKGYTPIHFAFEQGHYDIIKLFLKKGVNVNIKDNRGFYPIDLAPKAIKIKLKSLIRK